MKAKHIFRISVITLLALVSVACLENPSDARDVRSMDTIQDEQERLDTMNIKMIVGDKSVSVTLLDNSTAREFAALLPLTLTMNDLFGREKYGRVPKALSENAERSFTYSVGYIAYWSPAQDVAVFYKNDGQRIPSPGIIIIGTVDADMDILDVPGAVEVTFERM